MKRNLFIALAVVVTIVVAVVSQSRRDNGTIQAVTSIINENKGKTNNLIVPVKPAVLTKVKVDAEGNPLGDGSNDGPAFDAWVESLPLNDRKLGHAIVDASDKEDLDALKKLVEAARQSANPDIRQRMVDALGWFDKNAIAELSLFLIDANSDVAQSAFNEWDSAVDQVDDEKFGIVASVMAMKVLTDEDNLQCAACRIESAEDHKLAIEAIVEIVMNGYEAGVKAAKESYEFITGDEWTNVEDAIAKSQVIDKEDEE